MNFAERVKSFLAKSLTGGEGKDPDPDENLEEKEEVTEGGTEGESMDKGLIDATEILGSLVTELKDINKSLKALTEKQATLEKSQTDVGEAVVNIAEVVSKIAGTPISTKSVMAKGNLGSGAAAGTKNQQPVLAPTQAEFEVAQDILVKAVAANEITLQRAEMISSGLQRAMVNPGFRMKPEDYDFLARKMQVA